jgi:anaerobic carbon-monoxide dehydrogenase iron sulfur subunit
MAKHIEVNVDKCTGCKLCELACSAVKTSEFNPRSSRIKVVLVDIPEIPVPILTEACDYCFGNPACVSVCLPQAIVWKDMEARPPRPKVSEAKAIAHAWLESVSR